jgi:two-component system sensor histidine kinase KdpD
VAVAVAGVVLATVVIYPLKQVTPVVSLGVLYLLATLVVATYWGFGFGVATAFLSAAAFDYFQLPPIGQFALSDHHNWLALSALIVTAVAISFVAALARSRASEADQRRREADLAAELAQQLLGVTRVDSALAVSAQRVAAALGVPSAAIELRPVPGDERRLAFPLADGDTTLGTLLLPASLGDADRERVAARIVPSLQSLLAAAMHRAELQSEVVETVALRRSDEMKTALLRSVSHDLRTPLTAILTAAEALDLSDESVTEVRGVVLDAATRLWRLIEKLLDLSVLEAGNLEPRRDWYSIEEVLQEAIDHVDAPPQTFRLAADREMPLLRGDPAQLERAFANLLENAARHSAGKPVSVRARAVGERMRVRIVDQGPGISSSELERIFLPFYRSPGADGRHQGSGLGLAIAKGFVEVNGGRVSVESLPGQGSSFVVEFPLEDLSAAAPQQLAGAPQ